MIRFKPGFVHEYLVRDYLGLDKEFDDFHVLLSFCPYSWCEILNLNLDFYSL